MQKYVVPQGFETQTMPQVSSRSSEHYKFTPEVNACMHAKSIQARPTLCGSMDCSPPGSSVHGLLQARILGFLQGCYALLQGIFPTQRLNPIAPAPSALQMGSFLLSHQESPYIAEFVSRATSLTGMFSKLTFMQMQYLSKGKY